MTATYVAAMMDAETGGNQNYEFEGAADLFRKPAHIIVDAFMASMASEDGRPAPLSYELNSVIKKRQKKVVMATGSPGCRSCGCEALGNFQAVDTVYPVEIFRDLACFVALNRADEVPGQW